MGLAGGELVCLPTLPTGADGGWHIGMALKAWGDRGGGGGGVVNSESWRGRGLSRAPLKV
jgi:hypothetical protein